MLTSLKELSRITGKSLSWLQKHKQEFVFEGFAEYIDPYKTDGNRALVINDLDKAILFIDAYKAIYRPFKN